MAARLTSGLLGAVASRPVLPRPATLPATLPAVTKTGAKPPDDRVRRYESLRAALDLIDQGFIMIDGDLHLVAWNKTFVRLLDFPPERGYVGAPRAAGSRLCGD